MNLKVSRFTDRAEAGKKLAEKLDGFAGPETTVFAIPRGGVPVAVEVAKNLGADLDMVIPRKIPIPFNTEAGFGAVSEDGNIVLDDELVAQLGLTERQIQHQVEKVVVEIRRRSDVYRSILRKPGGKTKTSVIIDDGLASGYTALAAVKTLRNRGISKVIVAAPVISGKAYKLIAPRVDGLFYVILSRVYPFAVAEFYDNWYDLSDEEVIKYLEAWRQPGRAGIKR